jgi:antitoxin ParD1/3/4
MDMTNINVSLPEPLKLFVEEQVSKGGYGSVSEYLRELVLEARRRTERQELEAKLLKGLQAPISEMTTKEWTALRERILTRSPELHLEGQTAEPLAQRPLSEEELEQELVKSGFLARAFHE